MEEKMYALADLFNSFEGEFPYQGRYSTFIRFPKCNLKCEWCDTMSPNSNTLPTNLYSESKLIELITQSKLITFTGGEPSLYIEDIIEILNTVLADNIIYLNHITIETNGVDLDKFDIIHNHLSSIGITNPNRLLTVVWSPKLYTPQLRSLALTNLYDVYDPSYMVIKLVSDPTDMEWIDKVFIPNSNNLHGFKNSKNICIMFQTDKDGKYNEQNIQQTLQIATKYGTSISTRIHLEHNFK